MRVRSGECVGSREGGEKNVGVEGASESRMLASECSLGRGGEIE